MDNALISLQEIVSHQEDEILRLSDELYAQQKALALLRTEMDSLRMMVKTAANNESPMRSLEQETPPPHY